MVVGRVPGPLGANKASGRTHSGPTPLVGASQQPVQKSVRVTASPQQPKTPWNFDEVILFPPPSLAQGYIYKGKEATYGCWATTAEMIVKWRNPSAPFKRPRFADRVPDDDVKSRVTYMDYVNQCLVDWGFQRIPGASLAVYHEPGTVPFRIEDVPGFVGRNREYVEFDEWTTPLLSTQLRAYGPLYCAGSFFANGEHNTVVGGLQHAIAVFGAQWRQVYYVDPWDGEIKTMSAKTFDSELLRSNQNNMYRYAYARLGT